MAAFIIPLNGTPETFSISLANIVYNLTVQWRGNCWFLDISDASGNNIVSSIPLVIGVNLLQQYGYLNLGGALVVTDANNEGASPDYTELGTNNILLFVTT